MDIIVAMLNLLFNFLRSFWNLDQPQHWRRCYTSAPVKTIDGTWTPTSGKTWRRLSSEGKWEYRHEA
jgi:hypothetical protein